MSLVLGTDSDSSAFNISLVEILGIDRAKLEMSAVCLHWGTSSLKNSLLSSILYLRYPHCICSSVSSRLMQYPLVLNSSVKPQVYSVPGQPSLQSPHLPSMTSPVCLQLSVVCLHYSIVSCLFTSNVHLDSTPSFVIGWVILGTLIVQDTFVTKGEDAVHRLAP